MRRTKNNGARGFFICIAVIVIALLVLLFMPVNAKAYEGEYITTHHQDALHEAAEILRAAGYAEGSEVMMALKAAWWEDDDAMNILAKMCKKEAPGTPDAQYCPVWHQCCVMQNVINRTRMDDMPDTVRGVVSQKLPSGYYAYNPAYCQGFEGIERHYYELAKLVLDGDAMDIYDIPDDLMYHDNAPHGPIWKTSYVNTGYFASTTYFCTRG